MAEKKVLLILCVPQSIANECISLPAVLSDLWSNAEQLLMQDVDARLVIDSELDPEEIIG